MVHKPETATLQFQTEFSFDISFCLKKKERQRNCYLLRNLLRRLEASTELKSRRFEIRFPSHDRREFSLAQGTRDT